MGASSFHITGQMRESGKPVSILIAADSIDAAMKEAMTRGIEIKQIAAADGASIIDNDDTPQSIPYARNDLSLNPMARAKWAFILARVIGYGLIAMIVVTVINTEIETSRLPFGIVGRILAMVFFIVVLPIALYFMTARFDRERPKKGLLGLAGAAIFFGGGILYQLIRRNVAGLGIADNIVACSLLFAFTFLAYLAIHGYIDIRRHLAPEIK